MHSPKLLEEILVLKLLLDLSPPAEAPAIQSSIAEKMTLISTISKVPVDKVKRVVNDRYPDFVKSRREAGFLKQGPAVELKFPTIPPLPEDQN